MLTRLQYSGDKIRALICIMNHMLLHIIPWLCKQENVPLSTKDALKTILVALKHFMDFAFTRFVVKKMEKL